MNDAALDRMRQLKMQAVTTEDDLKQAKTLHQRLNQAYRDQLTQDEQESEEDYSESRIKTVAPKQGKWVNVKPDQTSGFTFHFRVEEHSSA
ncbi:hypothetical protein BGZ79_004692 [Entomortierella chlamydospora]|nr:hypothetical protein BGZ79_004692 [Entomortierella chlamydospora]